MGMQAVKAWMEHRPPEPVRRIQEGDRVVFGRVQGTVVQTRRSGDGFTVVGEDWLYVELDNGMKVTCKTSDVKRV